MGRNIAKFIYNSRSLFPRTLIDPDGGVQEQPLGVFWLVIYAGDFHVGAKFWGTNEVWGGMYCLLIFSVATFLED